MASSSSNDPLPDIYTYLDFRSFLQDWFDAKKRQNPRFSHRMFARLAGQRSPSLLHHVIRGERNLTALTTQAFAQAMKLGVAQARFFGHLVKLGQASTDEARNAAWEQIAATRRFREARQVEGAGFEYLSCWYYPAIRELAHRADFVPDPDWIAARLRPAISRTQATRALAALETMRLLVPDGDTLRPADASVVTPHEVAGLAVHNYHHEMLERAREAIAAFDPDERHLGGLTLAVPQPLVPRLKEEVQSFLERLLNLCDDASEPSDRVYQVNVQLFPLSESRES
ncbi:MAG: TIGR02147 family protein [Myxococcota bacterium]